MIEKIIARWIKSRMLSEETESYSTSTLSAYWSFISWMLGAWFGIGLLLSYITYAYGLDSSQCYLCNRLVQIIPTIDIAAGRSDFPNVMRIIWLYLTTTMPLITLALIASIPFISFDQTRPTSFKVLFWSSLIFGLLILISYIFIFKWGGVDGNTKNGKFFVHTIFGGYCISFSAFLMFPMNIYFLVLYYSNFFLHK